MINIKNTKEITLITAVLCLLTFTVLSHTSLCYAESRFLVKDRVIIDTKVKIVWTRDANLPKKLVTYEEVMNYLKNLNGKKYGGYNTWELPRKSDFDESFDHCRYRRDMENFNKKKYHSLGFINVRRYYYLTSDTVKYPRGAVVQQMTNPIKCGVTYGDYGYLWPICRQ